MTNIKDKPGGRPAKKRIEKQQRVVSTKLTELQYYAIRKRAGESGLRVSEYVRQAVVSAEVIPRLNRQDYVILNSTVNVPKAIDVLYPYERIHCMLDNDKAGYEATRAIELEYSYRVRDFSDNYRGYSDLNDYLCGRKQEQKNAASQVQETKQKTGQCAVQKQKRGRGI